MQIPQSHFPGDWRGGLSPGGRLSSMLWKTEDNGWLRRVRSRLVRLADKALSPGVRQAAGGVSADGGRPQIARRGLSRQSPGVCCTGTARGSPRTACRLRKAQALRNLRSLRYHPYLSH